MSRIIVGPFNRVEGDLEVKLDISGDAVRQAFVVSTLYRGFERILNGKAPADALVFAPRICGICSVSQSVAAAKALAAAGGVAIPDNGALAVNTIHATENIADHLTHFYLFFMPDFARATYAQEPWYEAVADRFTAIKGTATADMLPARAQFMHIMGILAGKWPHTLSIQPGGTTRSVAPNEIARLSAILAGFRRFVERSLLGDKPERVIALKNRDELAAWAEERRPQSSDFRLFLHVSKALELEALGNSGARFMSYGAYAHGDAYLFPPGVWHNDRVLPVNLDDVSEDMSHAWYDQPNVPEHPFDGTTFADALRGDAYSWCKAPRLGGAVVEVGALARQVVAGHPLIRDLVQSAGGNVHSRVVARVLEIALVTIAMQDWVRKFHPGETFCHHGDLPDACRGVGLTEAARGALGHWLKVSNGKIANYQIIAPTTWNFSPRDASDTPGALEQALVGAPVRPGETEPVSVQHIVRSFDPCLVCTVH
ncbi:MAG: nickel-dependent hydrogenase large subunit [Hyphomicrobiaceae bacterium]|nr:nickel-dependent hydrogenase large subunit [Hyphomicrobiaceae bacterium]MCC0009656.1 nickel-dependent hydrogenase large subunit [Hyphomicrobiaceae bacterium]